MLVGAPMLPLISWTQILMQSGEPTGHEAVSTLRQYFSTVLESSLYKMLVEDVRNQSITRSIKVPHASDRWRLN